MTFEKLPRCSDCWQEITLEQIRAELAATYQECTDAMIDLIFTDPKSTLETKAAKYRKFVPTQVKDWART